MYRSIHSNFSSSIGVGDGRTATRRDSSSFESHSVSHFPGPEERTYSWWAGPLPLCLKAAFLICQGRGHGNSGGEGESIRSGPQGERKNRCKSPGLCRVSGTVRWMGDTFFLHKGKWWLKTWRVTCSVRSSTSVVKGKQMSGPDCLPSRECVPRKLPNVPTNPAPGEHLGEKAIGMFYTEKITGMGAGVTVLILSVLVPTSGVTFPLSLLSHLYVEELGELCLVLRGRRVLCPPGFLLGEFLLPGSLYLPVLPRNV